MSAPAYVAHDQSEKAISRAVGEELRRLREAKGWSRAEFVKLLPSGIGEHSLLAYEHGLRQLTILAETHVIPALGARELRNTARKRHLLTADDVDEWLPKKATELSTRTLREIRSILLRSIRRAQKRRT